jgi:hypothetical protein
VTPPPLDPAPIDPSSVDPSPNRPGLVVWALAGLAILIAIVVAVALFSGNDESDPSGSDDQGEEAGDEPGATPEQISAGQEALQAVGCYTGAIDGKYGPLTDEAIREFQRASDIAVDGIFGPATLAALEAAVAAGETVCVAAPEPPADDGGTGDDGDTGGGTGDDGGAGGGSTDVVLVDAESPAGGTVKRLGIPGPERSVLLVCDQDGFEPFFFNDEGNWVGCQIIDGSEAGPESELADPVLGEVDGPAGGTVAQLTIPGPQTSVLVTCRGTGFSPFLFLDEGTWVGCQSR